MLCYLSLKLGVYLTIGLRGGGGAGLQSVVSLDIQNPLYFKKKQKKKEATFVRSPSYIIFPIYIGGVQFSQSAAAGGKGGGRKGREGRGKPGIFITSGQTCGQSKASSFLSLLLLRHPNSMEEFD